MPKYAVSEAAVKLLRRVKRHILAEPKRLDMNQWVKPSRQSPCGTAACIAGWTVLLSGPEEKIAEVSKTRTLYEANEAAIGGFGVGIGERARQLLGLTYEQSVRLFHVKAAWVNGVWPTEFARRYTSTKTTKAEKAKVAAERIDHFIRTGE